MTLTDAVLFDTIGTRASWSTADHDARVARAGMFVIDETGSGRHQQGLEPPGDVRGHEELGAAHRAPEVFLSLDVTWRSHRASSPGQTDWITRSEECTFDG